MSKDDQMILALSRENVFGCFYHHHFNGFIRHDLFDKQMHYLFAKYNNQNDVEKLFSRRGDLENNPMMKQIIPYTIIYHSPTKSYLSYIRPNTGGEDRLHGKLSIGFGGHIELEDAFDNLQLTIIKGANRELREELSLFGDITFTHVGYINDDSDPVGRVHFGVVTQVDIGHLTSDELEKLLVKSLPEAIGLEFRSLNSLQQLPEGCEYESWSKYVIDALPYFEI